MFLRKLATACLMGSMKCCNPDGSTRAPCWDNNASCGERPCKRASITESRQCTAVFQAQEIFLNTCRVCKFEHKNLKDNQHSACSKRAKTHVNVEDGNTSVEMYGYTLFRLQESPRSIKRLYTNFIQFSQLGHSLLPFLKLNYELSLNSHSECLLFRFTTFGWFKDSLETKWKSKSLNTNLFEIPMLQIDVVWLMAFIERLKLSRVQEQKEMSTIQTSANNSAETQIRNICMSLPNYVKEFLRSANQTNDVSEELLKPSTGQETWEEMIENPYLFYNRFSENMKWLKDLSNSYKKKLKAKEGDLKRIQSRLNEKDLNSQDKRNLESENSQVFYSVFLLKEKQKNKTESIVRAIDSMLCKIEREENDDQIENYVLKVILIMQIMNTCLHQGVNLCNCASVPLIFAHKLVENFEKDELPFKTFIYNLGTRNILWKMIVEPDSKEPVIDTIKSFQRFIDCTAPNQCSLKMKVITFWVAKVVLESSTNNLPLLCYILYKNQLMDESRVYMVFRYSYIIKRLFINKSIIGNSAFAKCCFEEPVVDNSIDFITNGISVSANNWDLVERLKINPNLLFSDDTVMMRNYRDKLKIDHVTNHQNGKKDFIMEKVTNLFMDMYSEMDSIIVDVRNMLLNPERDANQTTSELPKDGHSKKD